MVHKHNWTKWQLLGKEGLAADQAQEPGKIPDHILESLEPIIAGLHVYCFVLNSRLAPPTPYIIR